MHAPQRSPSEMGRFRADGVSNASTLSVRGGRRWHLLVREGKMSLRERAGASSQKRRKDGQCSHDEAAAARGARKRARETLRVVCCTGPSLVVLQSRVVEIFWGRSAKPTHERREHTI